MYIYIYRKRGEDAVEGETRKVKRSEQKYNNNNNNKNSRVYIILYGKKKRRGDSGARANNGREGIQIIIIRWKE